jgi:DNA alkylation repair enzyme
VNANAILAEIRPLGTASYKKVLLNHDAREPCYGVKIEALKKIQKRVGTDYRLALDLYDTGVYDAMYLAGLVADDGRMSKKDLRKWVKGASAPLACSTVAWVAAGSPHGRELALEWIDSGKELVAAAGWATLGGIVSVQEDDELDLAELKQLLLRVQREIHAAPNEVRSKMNGFVIAVGSHVSGLTEEAIRVGEKIGPVTVDMGNTACEVPFAPDSIRKVQARGAVGKKRKTAKC